MEPENRERFNGTATASKQGQVLVPAEARRDFRIQLGGKLLVFGDRGIAFTPFDVLRKTMRAAIDFLREVGPAAQKKKAPRSKKR